MADSETAPVTLDTWQQAINASIESPKKYLMFAKPLGLTAVAAQLEAGFPALVEQRLHGVPPAMAKDMRDALEFAHDICGDPWRSAFTSWLRDDGKAAELIAQAVHHPEVFSYHGFIGDLAEAYGQELLKGEHPVISPLYRAEAPDAVQYKTPLMDGTWKNITQEELLHCMRSPRGPHIVHSANHAFFDNENSDLTSLYKEFSKLFDGSRLPVAEPEPKDSGHLSKWDQGTLGPNDTVTVFATHTRANRFLNLGQLFHRLDGIDNAQANPQADTFQHVAPIATDMVEVLLKSLVVDEDVAKIHPARAGAGKPTFFEGNITLRPEAMEIIRRQRYRGFSKGGNDFRDGMRLLVHTLDAKDAEGRNAVTFPEGVTTHDLVNTISMIVFGLNEKPMADYYRENGVYVPIVSSKNDLTAPIPPFAHEAKEPVYNYKGNDKGDGHSPQYAVDGMLADWRIQNLLRMAGAVSQGQAAITDVNFLRGEDGKSYNPNVLLLEVAQGTSDAMMAESVSTLNLALRKAGLGDTTLKRINGNQGRERYYLINNDPMTKLATPENVEKLQGVFRSLCATCGATMNRPVETPGVHPGGNLWVSQATAFGKLSLMRRSLLQEREGKLDGPDSVVERTDLVHYVRLANARDVREHSRIQRNLDHARIATAEPAAAGQAL